MALCDAAYKALEMRSAMEGRSMSTLAAFIVETALSQDPSRLAAHRVAQRLTPCSLSSI